MLPLFVETMCCQIYDCFFCGGVRSVIIGTIAKIIYVTNFESDPPCISHFIPDDQHRTNNRPIANMKVVLIGQNQLLVVLFPVDSLVKLWIRVNDNQI